MCRWKIALKCFVKMYIKPSVLSMTIEIKWTISDLQRNWSILGREICICICNTKVWCLCNFISTSPKCHKIYMYLCTCGCYNINIVIVDHCSTCQHVHYNTYCIKIYFGWPLLSPVANHIGVQYRQVPTLYKFL